MLEYEEDPYIEITLFKHISLHIDFLAPKYNEKRDGEVFDVCYWEGILSMMNNVNSITGELKKPEEDALYDSYVENQWFGCYNKENEDGKIMESTHSGRHRGNRGRACRMRR